ncbi:MAG: FMN-binding protein [Bacillota bacterium]|nr:FMN-binding protein [Bacillota bacterium]
MRKLVIVLALAAVAAVVIVGCGSKDNSTNTSTAGVVSNSMSGTTNSTITQTKSSVYKDGIYEVATSPDDEGYITNAKVTITGGKISTVDWYIIDKDGKIFDEKYEEVFAGNKEYQQQCRNDLKGAKTYGPELIKSQDIVKVDAISGATWSNKKFKEVVTLALNKAKGN